MSRFLTALTLILLQSVPAAATSNLLNDVKRNPSEAKSLCRSFRTLNKKGKSAYSKKSTRKIAGNKGLNFQDAEVLVTYVVGMHCPDVQ